MNYFNEGCILLLNDFSDFCKHCNEDFDADHTKSLITPFLKSRQMMQSAEVKTSSSTDVIPEKRTKSPKTKTVSRKAAGAEDAATVGDGATAEVAAPKGGSRKAAGASKASSKNTEVSVDEFNKLSINEIKSSTWNGKILVSSLKELCGKLGLPVTKLTKTQIIDSLIKYKTIQENTNGYESEKSSSEKEEKELPEPSTQKPKRRVIASAIVKPIVTVTKKHDLNLVFCDDEDVILVLSENNQMCGFIPKEEYDENDIPRVLKPTKDVIRVAKNMSIAYEVPETIE